MTEGDPRAASLFTIEHICLCGMDMNVENGAINGKLSKIDRISSLPVEIREFMLGFLPITDAVRTSALSRKWRFTWTRAVQLNIHFDDDIDTEMEDDRYYRIVGNVFLSHVGRVDKCAIHVTERCFEGELNVWVRLLSRKNIKDLTIQSGYGYDRCNLPPSIFQCLGLSCLTLENFVLETSLAFNGFPNLVRLNLVNVDIHGDMLEQVVFGCPLEILLLEGCCHYSNGMDYNCYKSAISSCTLGMLSIVCTCFSLCNTHLKYTPNISVASFTLDTVDDEMDRVTSNCFDFLGSMPKIEDLNFDCELHKVG